jgi:hypothetical protein
MTLFFGDLRFFKVYSICREKYGNRNQDDGKGNGEALEEEIIGEKSNIDEEAGIHLLCLKKS